MNLIALNCPTSQHVVHRSQCCRCLRSISQRAAIDDIHRHDLVTPPSSDKKDYIAHPTLDSVYDIHKNFTTRQLKNVAKQDYMTIFEMVESDLEVKFISGKVHHSSISPIDVCCMLLPVLKSDASWTFCASQFKIRLATFERYVIAVLKTIAALLITNYFLKYDEDLKTHKLLANSSYLSYFKVDRYATDIRSQETNWPTQTHGAVKSWYSIEETWTQRLKDEDTCASNRVLLSLQHTQKRRYLVHFYL